MVAGSSMLPGMGLLRMSGAVVDTEGEGRGDDDDLYPPVLE